MVQPPFIRDPVDVKAAIEGTGVSLAEWARFNGFSTGLVYQVLDGRRKCVRGQSRKIAIALGLIEGEAFDVGEISERLKRVRLQPN